MNNQKLPGDLLESVIDDDGVEYFWIMAPKPGYEEFDITRDELVVFQGPTSDAAEVSAIFANIDGERYKTENCEVTLKDDDGNGWFSTFEVAADVDNCPTKGGATGVVGYTEEIDTYTYLQFDDTPDDFWRLATFDEMYITVENGGLYPWDDNKPTDDIFKGMKQSGKYLTITGPLLVLLGSAFF